MRPRFATVLGFALAAACSGPTSPPRPPDPGPATAPVIRAITVPTSRVEAGQDITITAIVEDAETPLTDLTFRWATSAGTITGSGTTATWTMPKGITAGVDVTVTLTVTDTYDALVNNQIVQRQFAVPGTSAPFRVHDSEAESKELARKFLIDLFGNSSVPPIECMADFADECADLSNGFHDELTQVIANRETVLVRHATMLMQRVIWETPDFGYVHNAVLYDDVYLDGTPKLPTCGDFEIRVIYARGRWWICQSFYNRNDTSGCPAATDNRAAAATLGSQAGKSGDTLKRILGRIR